VRFDGDARSIDAGCYGSAAFGRRRLAAGDLWTHWARCWKHGIDRTGDAVGVQWRGGLGIWDRRRRQLESTTGLVWLFFSILFFLSCCS
jgi:hypothetical protein